MRAAAVAVAAAATATPIIFCSIARLLEVESLQSARIVHVPMYAHLNLRHNIAAEK